MERNGIAYCADSFAKQPDSARIVCARPVFVTENTAQEQIPVAALYEHPDFVDIISAHEFGLDHLFADRFLLCVLVAQLPQALEEMETMIRGSAAVCKPCASAWAAEELLHLQRGDAELTVPLTDSAAALLGALAEKHASPVDVLAAVTQWCVGYPVTLLLPEALL